jgi:hypothetical protein
LKNFSNLFVEADMDFKKNEDLSVDMNLPVIKFKQTTDT